MNQTAGSILGLCAVAIWLVLAIPAVVNAHALGAEAKLKNGKVAIEAFYDDDTPADAAKVIITNADGKLIAEGKTDKDGKCSVEAPPPGKYKVVVDAGSGHRATVSLTIPVALQPQESSATPVTSSTGIAPPPGDSEIIVSEGPTRSEFTGAGRLVWAVAGVFLIGVGSWVLTRLFREVRHRSQTEGRSDWPQAS